MFRAIVMPGTLLLALIAASIFTPEFLNFPAMLLTLGGSVLVVLCSYTRRQIEDLFLATKAILAEKPRLVRDHVDELARLTQHYRSEGLRGLESRERRIADPFLRCGVGMLVDLQKEDTIRALLEREMAESINRDEMSCRILITLGKLLPALGLIGTLIGMVLLLRNLYTQDLQSLPAALSLAVLTTLYGAVFANILVAPLAARLGAAVAEKEMRMGLTLEWVMMVVRGDTATPVASNYGSLRSAAEMQSVLRDSGWTTLSPFPQR